MPTPSRAVRVLLALAVASLAACDPADEAPCCGVPVMQDTDVRFAWTVDGAASAAACAAAGATTVRLEVLASTLEPPAVIEVPCAHAEGTVRATVFAPALGTMSAGVAFARLLDAAGGEVTARRAPLLWSAPPSAGGTVEVTLALVTTPPAGALRYRWCEPLPPGPARVVVADGPMWKASVVSAGATEAAFDALAPGAYRFEVGEVGALQADVLHEGLVVEGAETVVTVYPCPR